MRDPLVNVAKLYLSTTTITLIVARLSLGIVCEISLNEALYSTVDKYQHKK